MTTDIKKLFTGNKININNHGEGSNSEHVNNTINLCNARIKDNKNDKICFCMLNHTQISCNNFAAEELKSGKDIASTLQLPDGRILEDKRTDADILKEVYFLICGIVPRKYS